MITDIKNLILGSDSIVENANKDSKLIPTMRDLTAGIAAKDIALNDILPKHIADAHSSGDIHFHDLDYSPLFPMFNCFSRETRFVTKDGVKSFEDYQDGDVIQVPTAEGNVKTAVVRCYGTQSLNEVTFKRGKGTKTVFVTSNHRWLLHDGTETTDLKVGDKLRHAPKPTSDIPDVRSGDCTKMFNVSYPTHFYWTVDSIAYSHDADVWCLEVEDDHSFILAGGMVTGNCMLIDVRNMLENGFTMGNAKIETPKSIGTATTIVSQIIQQVASHIYGGNSINRIDEVLAPYVRVTYNKHLEIGRQWMDSEAKAAIFARERTEKECYDAFQTLDYQINTMQTCNGDS